MTPPLAVLVPVYNEPDNLPEVVRRIEQHIPPPCDVYVVYDSDEDTTIPVLESLRATRPWLHPCRNTYGAGVAQALRFGFDRVAEGPVLVTMADGSDDLSMVPQMLARYEAGARIVCASRYAPGGRQIGGPWLKRCLSRLAGLSLRMLVGFPTCDATNNFRLYDAALVRELGIETGHGFAVALELTVKAFRRRVSIAEVPTVWRDRERGTSRFQLLRWLPRYLRWYWHAFGIKA